MTTKMKPRILCVDDETNVLESFRRLLRTRFDLNTASSGFDGLQLIEQNGPFAVIVSDMRMPGMNGVEFLKKAKEAAPDSIRIMLTGYADQQTAIQAINDGAIFRFLDKPIASEKFLEVLESAVRQYNLVHAERELLEMTLMGSIDVLISILALSNPLAFSRATRIRDMATRLAENLGMQSLWEIKVSSMLSHIAYVSIPAETLQKKLKGMSLDPAELEMFASVPKTTKELISPIPRLEKVVDIIDLSFGGSGFESISLANSTKLAAAVLRACVEFDLLIQRGYGNKEAIAELGRAGRGMNSVVLDQLSRIAHLQPELRTKRITLNQLRSGMTLNEDIYADGGLLVAPKGFRVNELIRQLLKNLRLQDSVPEYVEVVIEPEAEQSVDSSAL